MLRIRRVFILLAIILLGLITLEIGLRIAGFTNAVLFEYSDDYEYRMEPNQNVYRFFKRIITNNYGMRSDEVRPSAIKVIKIGDSVINGGSLTNHSELSSTLLSNKLSDELKLDIQVLNISCGSWGPDNGVAFLNKHGHFDARAMVMVYSSHDLYDKMTYTPVVGENVGYPSENYSFAIQELYCRYAVGNSAEYWRKQIYPTTDVVNPGFKDLVEFAKSRNMSLLAYLHPNIFELRNKEYDPKGEQIQQFWNDEGIEVIQGMQFLNESCYRDDIHLNEEGQLLMARAIYPKLKLLLEEKMSE